MKQERNANLDLIRVMSMIFVIAVHSPVSPFSDSYFAAQGAFLVFILCDGLFFMISGQLNLSKPIRSYSDMVDFYIRKGITILIPFVLAVSGFYAYNCWKYSVPMSLYGLYREFIGGYASTYLWFVYVLFGFMLSTPILSRALQSFDRRELNLVMLIALLWNSVEVYLAKDLDLEFGFSGWLLSGLMVYYVAGYYISRGITARYRWLLYAAGVISYGVTLIGSTYFWKYYKISTDQAPLYILFSMAVYTFLAYEVPLTSKGVKKVIAFLARHAYTVYLTHAMALDGAVSLVGRLRVPDTAGFALVIVLTLTIGLTGAVLLDELLIFPLQKYLQKAYQSGKARRSTLS